MTTFSPGSEAAARSGKGTDRPDASVELVALIALLVVVCAFEVALAAGAPWGRFAWGGGTDGVLPASTRIGSAVSAGVYLAIMAIGWVGPTTAVRRRVLRGLSVLMGLGTLLNLASPSWAEKLLWTPVAATLAVLLWRRASTR